MLKQVEAQYTLFESLEEMLSPRALSQLLQKPVSDVNVIPLGDNGGLSCSRFSAVETDAGRYFLKRMSSKDDFLMLASDDVHCRAVTLWQYGLLDEIRPFLGHKIVGCARDGDGWAILMADLRDALFTEDRPFTKDHSFAFLDALARMHATFWDDARLADPALGLMDTLSLVDMFSPLTAERYQRRTNSPIPQWIIGGWQVLPELVSPAAFRLFQDLRRDPLPLVDAMARCPCTLAHGDYRTANFAYDDGRCIAFDWQMAANTLMTTNLSRYVRMHKEAFTAIGIEKAIATYRERLETYLQRRFGESEWEEMVDLGFAADAQRMISMPAFWAVTADTPEDREVWRRMLDFLAHNIVKAAKWL